MAITLLIAGSDSICCSEIKNIISNRYPDVLIAGICSTGENLYQQFLAIMPDVVISAAIMSDMSCFDVIYRININHHYHSQFIVYGDRDFDSAYKCLKYGASDYLLLPISPSDLSEAMDKACSLSVYTGIDNASRLFYIDDRGIDSIKKKKLSIDQVNTMFGTHFQKGLFRMIFVKYDFPYSFEWLNVNNSEMLHHTDEQIRKTFGDFCSDIVCTQKSDGIMAVLNYRSENSPFIELRISELYQQICRTIKNGQNVQTTICVSNEIDDPCNVWQIKEQVRDVEWSRIALGTNQILYWSEDLALQDPAAQEKLTQIFGDIRFALDNLNVSQLQTGFNKFYELPQEILLTHEARISFKKILDFCFDRYWDTISKFTDPSEVYEEIGYMTHFCTSFSYQKNAIISKYVKLLQDIIAQTDKNYSFTVAEAITYIKNNIDKAISLKSISETLNISQAYFSSLFKKETGTNFSKFVKETKNQAACKFLVETKQSISEIAFRTGFNNVRSFSKYFKSMNGVTPTRYRQLHQLSPESIDLKNED